MKTNALQAEIFCKGSSLGSVITEGADQLLIGNSKRADLVLPPSATDSQIHALLRLTEKNEIHLFDLGSTNGTFVGGVKIIEQHLGTGETFAIGDHEIRVRILENTNDSAPFWAKSPSRSEHLDIYIMDQNIAIEEFSLSANRKLKVGKSKNQIHFAGLPSGSYFIKRKDGKSEHSVEATLPLGYVAEIYDRENKILRAINQDGANFVFCQGEKMRIFMPQGGQEIFAYWRATGDRLSRSVQDQDAPILKKSLIATLSAAAILVVVLGVGITENKIDIEASIPKTPYFRLTTESAPAAAAPAPAAALGEAETAKPSPATKATQASQITSSLAKLFQKKPSLDADKIREAVSKNGKESTRLANVIASTNFQQKDINAGAIGGAGSINVNAIKAGLTAGAGGKVGNMKGFAGGSGTMVGGATGSMGGKGFDMSIGGEEEEAVGGLDKSLIAAVVQANLGQIKHCYEKQLLIDANLFGKVVAQWTITKDGLVSTDSVKKTTMNNAPVENCILGKIKNWNFPKPKGGGVVLVSYPFLFKSMN